MKKWLPLKFDKNDTTKWNWMCQHHNNLKCGKNVDIGAFTYMNAKNRIEIGDDVKIGSHCSIYTISTIDHKVGPVIIKNGAKIGTHTTIMPRCMIGENSTIGAHSFVNRSIPDNCIAFGVPVRIIRGHK